MALKETAARKQIKTVSKDSVESGEEDACTVCLPWEQDATEMPYPRKMPKAKAREATSFVAIVERKTPDGQVEFLLIQRPEKGMSLCLSV